MWFFLRPIRFFISALIEDNTPNQMALGFALGLTIGLVPKGNLIAIALMAILGVIRVNLGVGMLTALAVSFLAGLFDPVTNGIGLTLLRAESLVPWWTEFAQRPLAPWTKFNNTVVLGSLAMGLMLFMPAWLASRPVFAKYTPDWSERLKRTRLVQLLFGAEVTSRL